MNKIKIQCEILTEIKAVLKINNSQEKENWDSNGDTSLFLELLLVNKKTIIPIKLFK